MGLCLGRALKQRGPIQVIYGGTFFGPETESFLADHADAAGPDRRGRNDSDCLAGLCHPRQSVGTLYLAVRCLIAANGP